MLSLKSSRSRLDRDLSRAKSYEEWLELAQAHDEATGMDKWKLEPNSTKYDDANIQYRVDELRKLRANHDDVGLLFALNEGIHGNQGGIGNEALYEKAKFGTKNSSQTMSMKSSMRCFISSLCLKATNSTRKIK